MFSSCIFVFVTVFIAGCTLCTAQNYLGDACTLERTRESGVCQNINDCDSAKEDLKRRIHPQICHFIGVVPIVCCPVRVRRPLMRSSNPQRDMCLNTPIKESAVKVMKTGRKAWDKCIDLAESVFPCVPAGFTINTRWARGFECSHTATPLIIGGVEAIFGEFPHMAALGTRTSPFTVFWHCGGTLISDQWVLTAAHCLTIGLGSEVSHVRLGGLDTDEQSQEEHMYTVIERVPHPDHKRPAKYNDIALIKLDRKVPFSRQVRPACLHTGEEINDDKAIVIGWGSTSANGNASDQLLKTTLEKFSFSDCSKKYPPMRSSLRYGIQNETQMCYGHRTLERDTCKGDSGGPLQIYNSDRVECTYLVFGITSNGKICGTRNMPAIYTRVSRFISWIEDTVWPDTGIIDIS